MPPTTSNHGSRARSRVLANVVGYAVPPIAAAYTAAGGHPGYDPRSMAAPGPTEQLLATLHVEHSSRDGSIVAAVVQAGAHDVGLDADQGEHLRARGRGRRPGRVPPWLRGPRRAPRST
ncbi:MAG: hypothetical protein V9E93_16710 [Steroidobacteraceae bacterium]